MSQLPPSVPVNPFGGEPGFGEIAAPKSWPKVIGIISIVYGSLGIICNACGVISGLAGPALSQSMINMVPEDQRDQMAAQMQSQQTSIGQIVVAAVSFLWAIFLIVAGAALVRRLAKGRGMHLIWAVVAMILWAISLVLTIGQVSGMKAQFEKQAAAAGPGGPSPDAMMMGAYGGTACVMLIALAYPLFILIWFGLVKKDTREITLGAPEPTL